MLWRNQYEQHLFSFEGRKAIVVLPDERAKTGKWILKTEYFEAFQDLEEEFVAHGYALAYVANRDRWGAEVDLDTKQRFCAYVSDAFQLEKRCIPIGMSCGGLIAIKLAAKYPEIIRALYLDAPVVNLLSCPCGLGVGSNLDKSNIEIALRELDLPDLSAMLAYRNHPLDNIPALIANRIPVALVCGDSDSIVPYSENGVYVKNAYEQTDIPFKFLMKEGVGHHPHGPGKEAQTNVFSFLDSIP